MSRPPRLLLWLIWLYLAANAAWIAYSIGVVRPKWAPMVATSDQDFAFFVIILYLIPTLVSLALRFWVSRIRDSWWILIPYVFGVFIAFTIAIRNSFLPGGWRMLSPVLSAFLFLLYLPFFFRTARGVPPQSAKPKILRS